MGILNEAKVGVPGVELCHEHGVGNSISYKCRAKCGDFDMRLITRMERFEEENRRLIRMYAEKALSLYNTGSHG